MGGNQPSIRCMPCHHGNDNGHDIEKGVVGLIFIFLGGVLFGIFVVYLNLYNFIPIYAQG